MAELGEPFAQLWTLLEARYGSPEAARVLARIIGAVVDQGEAAVASFSRRTVRHLPGSKAGPPCHRLRAGSGLTPVGV